MRIFPALAATMLLPSAAPVLLSATVGTSALTIAQAPAQAENAEPIADVAHAITVRIEASTQGSGVLVKRDGNRYTVLSAWHVVSAQLPSEEIDIYTSDGTSHKAEQGSVRRLGNIDMAILTFISSNRYSVANIKSSTDLSHKDKVFVAGYPVGDRRSISYSSDTLLANARSGFEQGYQLLYFNQTTSGMSGGPILDGHGFLVGIHGRGALDEFKSQQSGSLRKLEYGYGIPISYYQLFTKDKPVLTSESPPSSIDDFLLQLHEMSRDKAAPYSIDQLASRIISDIGPNSSYAYLARAGARMELGLYKEAIEDINRGLEYANNISSKKRAALISFRGNIEYLKGDLEQATRDYLLSLNLDSSSHVPLVGLSGLSMAREKYQDAFDYLTRALTIEPNLAYIRSNLGEALNGLKRYNDAVREFDVALSLRPNFSHALYGRSKAKLGLGNEAGAIADISSAINLQPLGIYYNERAQYRLRAGDCKAALPDLDAAISNSGRTTSIDSSVVSMMGSIIYKAYAVNNRAYCKRKMGDHQGAIDDYLQVIAENPGLHEPYLGLGDLYRDLNQLNEARSSYTKAIMISPNNGAAHRGLAVVESSIGNESAACLNLKIAASLGDKAATDFLSRNTSSCQ